MSTSDPRRLASVYLEQIRYRASEGPSCREVSTTLQDIFHAAGQQNLFLLARLRQMWSSQIDPFLAQHTFPRNLAYVYEYTLNRELLPSALEPADWDKALQRTLGKMFSTPAMLRGSVRKLLRRPLSASEQELLAVWTQSTWQGRMLHLTVYDGAFVQAIRLEQSAYLAMFHEVLPQLRLLEIRAHVGDPDQMRLDQQALQELAEHWSELPDHLQRGLVPGFVHRASKFRAVLMLHPTSEGAAAQWPQWRRRFTEWLQLTLPQLAQEFHDIALLSQTRGAEQFQRLKAQGESASLVRPPAEPATPAQATEFTLSTEERVHNILERLRKKPARSGPEPP